MERLLSIFLCILLFTSPSFAKDSKESKEKSHEDHRESKKDDHHNSKYKHLVPPQAHLRVDSKPCQSPCMATLDASKSRAHKDATIIKYVFDFGDGSPLFESSNPIVTYNYIYIKESLAQKHKHKKNIKEFHPKVFVIDSNNKKSKSDKEKVRIIAQTDTTPVNQAPVASLSVSPNSGVAPLLVTLNASASSDDKGIALYTFEFGDGEILSSTNPSVSHTYAAGNFSAKVSVFDVEGLTNTASASITVTIPNTAPIANLSATPISGDAPLTVTFNSSLSSDDKAVVNRVYSFGDGQSLTSSEAIVSHVYQAAGSYSASVSVSDLEGLSSVSASIAITAQVPNVAPIASLSVNSLRQNPNSLFHFDATASSDADNNISSYTLTNLSSNEIQTNSTGLFDVALAEPGYYSFRLAVTDSFGLTGNANQSVVVNAPPIVLFSSDKLQGLAPLTVTFDSSLSNDDLGISKRFYTFENSLEEESNLEVISHTFNNPGTYNVALRVQDADGLESSTSIEITVSAPSINHAPIAELFATPISGVAPLTVNFDSSASNDDKGIASRNYEFAPNVFAKNEAPAVSYTYNTPGNYEAFVTVFDIEGASSQKSVAITVNAPEVLVPPIAWFQIEVDPTTGQTKVKNQAVAGSSPISSVSYSINNGAVSLTSAPYAYSEAFFQAEGGLSYEIKQTVTDEQNQSSETIISVVMDETQQAPVPQFSLDQSNVNQVFLNALYSFDLLNSTTSMRVNWGDQTPEETLASHFANHTYQSAGTYSVTLTLDNAQGLSDSLTREISVTNFASDALLPVANFSIIYDEGAKYVKLFSQDSASPNGDILSYFWEYGDGQVGYGEQAVHFYGLGSHLAKLTVTDSMGLKASQVQQIIVTDSGPPIISGIDCRSFGLYGECDFFAAHKDKQLDRIDVDWGDGNIDSYPVANNEWQTFDAIGHFYQSAGTYDVAIHAITFLVEESISSTQIITNGDGSGNIAPIAELNCYVIEYTNVICDGIGSFDPDGFIVNYQIDMGDGTNYAMDSVSHTYAQSGNYQVTLKIIDNLGLQTIAQTSLTVLERQNEAPIAYLFCDNSQPRKLICDASGTNDPDGTISNLEFIADSTQTKTAISSEEKVALDFPIGGDKLITLKVTDNEGRTTEISQAFSVENNLDPIAILNCSIVSDKTVSCDASGSNDPEGSALTFEIKFGVESTSTEASFQYAFYSFGEKIITLTVTDSQGFKESTSQTVNLINLTESPTADFAYEINHDTKEVSFDGSLSTVNGKVVSEYRWDFNNDGIIDFTSPEPRASFIFSEFINYTVSLTVVDSQGRLNLSSKTFKIINMPVPDPGVAGKQFIEGIDSDGDGVRDDVQRLVITLANNNEESQALRQLASKLQKLAETSDQILVNRDWMMQALDGSRCYSYFEEVNFEKNMALINAQVFNTRERFLSYIQSKLNFAGVPVNAVLNHEELRGKCEF